MGISAFIQKDVIRFKVSNNEYIGKEHSKLTHIGRIVTDALCPSRVKRLTLRRVEQRKSERCLPALTLVFRGELSEDGCEKLLWQYKKGGANIEGLHLA